MGLLAELTKRKGLIYNIAKKTRHGIKRLRKKNTILSATTISIGTLSIAELLLTTDIVGDLPLWVL